MEEDAESAQRSAQRAASGSGIVTSGSGPLNVVPTTPIYQYVYDDAASAPSNNTPTTFISQHLTPASSRNQPGTHGASRCGYLVPAMLATLLLTCVTLLSVLISLRVSGRSPECPRYWITINNKCYFFSEFKKSFSRSDDDCGESDSSLASVKEETIWRLVAITGKEFWVGLTKDDIYRGLWSSTWTDGAMKTVIESAGNCVKLGSRLAPEKCNTELHYICEKDSA
ncbi:C-type lectin domain family 2 member L-like [Lithobates pipiens]